jgi:thiamine pyrophosphate-dependent acetolactate synthase large subunit-like protein
VVEGFTAGTLAAGGIGIAAAVIAAFAMPRQVVTGGAHAHMH